jgi:hypothetical protein
MPESSRLVGGKLADPEWRRSRARKAGRARTTPLYHLERLREVVETTRAEQGLPPTVTDALALGYLAELLRGPNAAVEVAP